MTIRPATPGDVPAVLQLVRELAAYEKEPDAVEASDADFRRVLFPADGHPTTFCHVAEVDGEVVGIAVWFLSFSTWTGRNGIWLEDLFVLPEHRGAGLGKALLRTLAQVCVERGYQRLEWWVLDWNEPSIAFYEALGARAQDEWTTYRLDGEALDALGSAGGTGGTGRRGMLEGDPSVVGERAEP
jgi:GNAT superfamily N-acetyltransferase